MRNNYTIGSGLDKSENKAAGIEAEALQILPDNKHYFRHRDICHSQPGHHLSASTNRHNHLNQLT
jgi:hypothetical protein